MHPISFALLCMAVMFTLQSFFPTLPSEEPIERRRQQVAHADAEGFCQQLILQMIGVPATPSLSSRRRPSHPLGTFDVDFFCRRAWDCDSIQPERTGNNSTHAESTRKSQHPCRLHRNRPLLRGLPTLGGGVHFCHFWVGLVGPQLKISFFPTRKVFKILCGWVSEITPPPSHW